MIVARVGGRGGGGTLGDAGELDGPAHHATDGRLEFQMGDKEGRKIHDPSVYFQYLLLSELKVTGVIWSLFTMPDGNRFFSVFFFASSIINNLFSN